MPHLAILSGECQKFMTFNMVDEILQVVYFMLPAYAANVIPVFFSHVSLGKALDAPVDRGRSFFGKRILGDHKTVKGFVLGTLGGVLVGVVQYYVGSYSFYMAVLIGALLGFGALVGDSVKSFIKRRIGIRSGGSFPVIDQIDFPIGALVFGSIAVDYSIYFVVLAIVVSGILSFLADIVGYLLGIKKVWW